MSDATPTAGRRHTLLLALIAFAILRAWLMPLGSSLWLDETGTYYLVRDGWSAAVERTALTPQVQTLPYTAIVWAALTIAGTSEIVLRLPSVLAMALAGFLLHRIARRFLDEEGALLAVAVFVSLQPVAFAAADARPYASAMAAALGSTWMLVRWFERGQIANAAAYAVLAALTVHLHYLFGSMLVVHATYAGQQLRRGSVVPAAHALGGGLTTAILLAPLLASPLWSSPRMVPWAAPPGLTSLAETFAPAPVVFALLAGLCVSVFVFERFEFRGATRRADLLRLAVVWALLPPVSTFLVSVLGPYSVFLPRYHLVAYAGMALLAAWAIRGVNSSLVRRVTAIVLVVTGTMSSVGVNEVWPLHGGEDWRAAVAAARSAVRSDTTPVLLRSGYVEASNPQLLRDKAYRGLLSAPLAAYPLRGEILVAPYNLSASTLPYLASVLAERLVPAGRFVLISRSDSYELPTWLDGRLRLGGFRASLLGHFRGVMAVVYAREESAPQGKR